MPAAELLAPSRAGPPAVFFDFGGTLCRSTADILPFFQEAARRAGVSLPWDDYLRANEACWAELWPEAPGLVGKLPSFADRVHEAALRRIGFDGPVEPLVRAIREEAVAARHHAPYPETEPTLRGLRARGISLHIVSGHVDYLPIIVRNLGWSELFDSVTFTQEVGFQKPDRRVFEFALRRAGRPAAGSLFVGDSWEADYLGASRAGLTAVWLNRAGRPAPGPCREIASLLEVPGLLDEPARAAGG